ncbi:MAG TPA: 3-methyladenine DNA glycosylase [Balneolaceae bacterium]|nr:3-methyladenine DNA glycosylase [Balneolaceae bacterium]
MIESHVQIPNIVNQQLPREMWQDRQKAHRQAIAEIVDPYLEKKQHQHKDPVLDFLFEYYAFRPSHLKKWSPGPGILLEGANRLNAPDVSEFTLADQGAFLDVKHFPENRKSSAEWILSVLENSLQKKPSFGCFGMHEWAMVYKADSVRHSQFPLRLSPKELAEFVESRPLVCTHFDAFRFFTEPARPMNKFDLSREKFNETEQAGCLHTNMDLYKWAFKMFPWIGSDVIRRAFLLAVDTRLIDMKASPYDLRKRGLEPIKIETEAGRMKYVEKQKEIYRRSVPVRKQLISEYRNLIRHF